MPKCKVRFPVVELAAATLSCLHESESKPGQASNMKSEKRQRDDGMGATLGSHVDVWLPLAMYSLWTTGAMSDALVIEQDSVHANVSALVYVFEPCH
jgi:hypothetical protein